MPVPGIIPGPYLLCSIALRRQQLFECQQVGIGLRTFHHKPVIPGTVFVRSGIEAQRQCLLSQLHHLVSASQPVRIRCVRRESAFGKTQPQRPGLIGVKSPFLTFGLGVSDRCGTVGTPFGVVLRIEFGKNRTIGIDITLGIEHILPGIGDERQFVIVHFHFFQFVGFHRPPIRNAGRAGTFAEMVVDGVVPLPDFLLPRTRQQGDDRIVLRHAEREGDGFAGTSAAVDLQRSVVFAFHVITKGEITAARLDIGTVGLADLPERRDPLFVEPEPDDIRMLFLRGDRIIGVLVRGNISQTVFLLTARQTQGGERQ